jgi:exodeoxyribonuclease VII small subunit
MAKNSFEQLMSKLEQIVEELDSGELPLEQALKSFEEGIKISRQCSKKLDETEKKITLLLSDGDAVTEKEFEE